MKPFGKDMLSLLVAVVITVGLLWGSDTLTHRLIERQEARQAAATFTNLLPADCLEVFALVALTLTVITVCAVSSF